MLLNVEVKVSEVTVSEQLEQLVGVEILRNDFCDIQMHTVLLQQS